MSHHERPFQLPKYILIKKFRLHIVTPSPYTLDYEFVKVWVLIPLAIWPRGNDLNTPQYFSLLVFKIEIVMPILWDSCEYWVHNKLECI